MADKLFDVRTAVGALDNGPLVHVVVAADVVLDPIAYKAGVESILPSWVGVGVAAEHRILVAFSHYGLVFEDLTG